MDYLIDHLKNLMSESYTGTNVTMIDTKSPVDFHSIDTNKELGYKTYTVRPLELSFGNDVVDSTINLIMAAVVTSSSVISGKLDQNGLDNSVRLYFEKVARILEQQQRISINCAASSQLYGENRIRANADIMELGEQIRMFVSSCLLAIYKDIMVVPILYPENNFGNITGFLLTLSKYFSFPRVVPIVFCNSEALYHVLLQEISGKIGDGELSVKLAQNLIQSTFGDNKFCGETGNLISDLIPTKPTVNH